MSVREKLESYFTRLWYSSRQVPLVLRGLTKVFDAQRKRREHKLKAQWTAESKLPVPVIVVGNISIGGTGKTPIVLFLIDELRRQAYQVGVISRGYGAQTSSNEVLILDEQSTAKAVGDEAYMVYQHSKVPFAIGVDRVAAAKKLIENHPDLNVIISDDGLQHYKLQRDVELIVVDGERGFGNARLIPAGPLREPLERLESVDMLLCNGLAKHSSLNNVESLGFSLQASFFRRLNNPKETSDFNHFYAKKVEAFAGIGNPERFFKLLESMGLEVNRHYVQDHGRMPDEFFLKHKNSIVVMTEKDAVKYANVYAADFWYLPVEVSMSEKNKTALLTTIINKIQGKDQGKSL